jgi:N4-gp56 family major capsid protein
MANETLTSSLTDIAATTAYDLLARTPLRAALIHEQFATVKSTMQSHNGASVNFNFVGDLTLSTTPLADEISDAPQEALSDTAVNVTMAEYGRVVAHSAKVRGTAMVAIDPLAAERVGRASGVVHDELARLALAASANQSGTTGGLVDLSSGVLRRASAALKAADVAPFMGDVYACVIHPDQEYDLRIEADAAGWRYYAVNQNPGGDGASGVRNGSVGVYEGFQIMVTSRTGKSGAGATTDYTGLVFGAEALAKAYSRVPGFGEYATTVFAEPIDNLKRVMRVGYYWLGGYAILRTAAVRKINSGSSLN